MEGEAQGGVGLGIDRLIRLKHDAPSAIDMERAGDFPTMDLVRGSQYPFQTKEALRPPVRQQIFVQDEQILAPFIWYRPWPRRIIGVVDVEYLLHLIGAPQTIIDLLIRL